MSPFSSKISRTIFNFTPFTMARIEPRTCFIILRLHIFAFEFLSEFIVAFRSWVFVHFECTHSRQTSGCLNAAICWVSSMETFKMQRLQHNARQLESREAQLHYVNMISLESFPLVNVGHPESFTFRLLHNEKTRSCCLNDNLKETSLNIPQHYSSHQQHLFFNIPLYMDKKLKNNSPKSASFFQKERKQTSDAIFSKWNCQTGFENLTCIHEEVLLQSIVWRTFEMER